jgi:hypothetical protein
VAKVDRASFGEFAAQGWLQGFQSKVGQRHHQRDRSTDAERGTQSGMISSGRMTAIRIAGKFQSINQSFS